MEEPGQAKLTEEELLNILHLPAQVDQEVTVEQIQELQQELAAKGLGLNQQSENFAQMLVSQQLGLANDNQEQELLAMQNFTKQMSDEERRQLLHQELLRQYPSLSQKQIQEQTQEQCLSAQFDPLQQQALKLAEIYNNEDQVLIQNNVPDTTKFATPLQKNEPNMSENDFNIDEKLNEEERLRDVYFEQQLRILFKNMMERLPNSTMEKISKKSKQFCEQINKVQLDYIQQKKQKKKEVKQNGDNQSETSTIKEPGEEYDADSSFYSVLYGENSTLNPDPYINEILNCLNNQQDLKNQFKRFLPEDEDEIQEMQQKLQNLQQSMALDEVPMGTELDRSYDEQVNINKLKRDAYHNLFKLLGEYEETKEKSKTFINQSKQKTINESLNLIGMKIMKVAENYQKYVKDDIKIQLEQNKSEDINYLEYLEKQMSMILSIIPQEIIDAYNVSDAVLKQQVNKKHVSDQSPTKSRTRKQRRDAKESDEEQLEESSPDQEQEDQQSEPEEDATGAQVSQSEQDEDMQEEAEEEFEEEMEEEIEEDEEDNQSNEIDNEQPYKIKSLMSEMAQSYPSSGKELSKHELRIFESLHKQMKSETDWVNFNKLLLLYIEGVICLNDLFIIFQEKYGHRIKEDLMQELEQLLPSRDHNRRHLSDLLKPWNDHEHHKFEKLYDHSQRNDDLQKFEKVHDLSYFKIDDNFPLPLCTARDNPENKGFYSHFLNNRYLSLSMGLENFKFKWRNANEEMIFKNEDDMYKLDTQIEMFEKCRLIIDNEIKLFDDSKNQKQLKNYEFPIKKLKPLMYFWEKRYKDILIPMLMIKPLKKEFLVSLQQAIGSKLQELQNFKLDQMSTFQDVFRKNFNKSLDHRSFLYKDFIKKYQQKQTHMTKIKETAEENQAHLLRHINLMKGGNHHESDYFHSFDNFLTHDFKLFDGDKNTDFPINMDYPDVDKLAQLYPHKFPHQRLIMKDQEVIDIVIKLICLNIRYSGTYHNNDRPRLVENLRFLIQDFLQMDNFKQLNQSCGYGKVDSLNNRQLDMLMNKDNHFYYKLKSVQLNSSISLQNQEFETVKSFAHQIKPLAIQISAQDMADQASSPVKSDSKQINSSPSAQKQASEVGSPSLNRSSPLQRSELSSPEAKTEKENVQENKPIRCGSNSKDHLQSEFLPHYSSDSDYKLLFTQYNVFMFLKFFHAIYERILKAKELITDKVNLDLSEISLNEKNAYQITDTRTNKPSQKHMDAFASERLEYFIRGIFTLTSCNSAMSSNFLGSGGIVQSVTQQASNILDQSKFEDFSRILLGKNAFLLFQVDKLLNQALKQLQQMHNDNQCQKSFKLYKKFNASTESWNENLYLSSYAHEGVEKFSLAENLGQRKSYKQKVGQCGHSAAKFAQGKQGLENEYRQTRSETNPNQSSSISTLNQNNFQVFRLLYSPISQVLSIHFLNLNPYGLQIQNFRNQMKDNFTYMKDAVHQTAVPGATASTSCECKPNAFVQDSSQPPIFLKRNLKAMLKHRSKQSLQQHSIQSNNLQMEVVPQVHQLVFTPSQLGEDVFIYRHRKTNLFDDKQTMLLQDLEKQVLQNNNIMVRLSKIQKTQE